MSRRRWFHWTALLLLFCGLNTALAWAQNPFTGKQSPSETTKVVAPASGILVKVALWQQKIRSHMADQISVSKAEWTLRPFFILIGLAFGYGALHAAGPGHGKFVAMSYVLSHKTTIMGGLLFSLFIAIFHGFSGAVGVLGLRYIIQRGIGETLGTVTTITQIMSFGLITLLGLSILLKNGWILFFKPASVSDTQPIKASRKGLLPWAVAIGLVPCPAVVMVMLFCLSMDVMTLGLLLAACISLGMAATISLVVTAAVMGKTGALQAVSKKRAETIEGVAGIISGTAIAVFGLLFLLAAINLPVFSLSQV